MYIWSTGLGQNINENVIKTSQRKNNFSRNVRKYRIRNKICFKILMILDLEKLVLNVFAVVFYNYGEIENR